MEGERCRPPANLEHDTAGRLIRRYEIIGRAAGHLACGDLLLEPVLGEVRVVQVANLGYDEVRHRPLVQVHWIDDAGLSLVALAYPVPTPVSVNRLAPDDRALVCQGVEQARYHQREIAMVVGWRATLRAVAEERRARIDASAPRVVVIQLRPEWPPMHTRER